MLRKHINAYFTIEASFIIPFTLCIFFLIIYFTFYLYNHCVVRQSIYIAELRGQQMKNVSNAAIKEYVDEQLDKLLKEQVFQYQIDYSSDVNYADIKVKSKSSINNKMSAMGVYNPPFLVSDENKTILRFYPAEFIRAIN